MTDAPAIDPRHTALLLMDFQPGIISRLPDADELLSRVTDTIALARSRGIQIGYVRVAFDDADYAAMPVTNKTFAHLAANRMLHKDAPETAIHEQLAPKSGDIIVRKTRVGAFSTTDLDKQLRDKGITTLILAGIATSGVVLSTTRDAADRDYQLFILSDGSADADPEVHRILTEKVFPRQAHVITIADLPGLLPAA